MSVTAAALSEAVEQRLARLAGDDVIRRIWDRDPMVWNGSPETPELADRLGWLTVCDWTVTQLDELERLRDDVRDAFDRVLLLGMGGSSLAPEVLARCFGRQQGFPAFEMLDSTHPAAVRSAAERAPLDRTLFVVASKSGTTIETMSLYDYFWSRVAGRGAQFVAITDAGTPLERLAVERGFRAVFTNPADVGGRYAALSLFGVVPAALMGLDVRRLVDEGRRMADACRAGADVAANPGARLGVLVAEAALAGRDKLTLCLDPIVRSFGLWAEQLVAESTGKDGKGIVPVSDEDLSDPPAYADDRLFVTLALEGTRNSGTLTGMRAIVRQGHPMHHLEWDGRYAVGAEFFRWEFATAVMGHVLGVNPFDQPNVAESKANTKRVLEGGETREGREGREGREAREGTGIERFLERVRPGEYVALLAYLPPSWRMDQQLTRLQTALRDRVRAAVTVGYGPRYLHSTGQLHKGGPPKGHFIQIVDRSGVDVEVPGAEFSFRRLIDAQAAGDYAALAARDRPILRVEGLEMLERAVR